jgi:hypothetical protein
VASILDLLRPIVITKVVSQIAAASSRLLMSLGMQPGGPLERPVGGRAAQFDVFDNVRTVGFGRAPGAPAGHRARQPVNTVPFVFPRHFELVHIDAEHIHNFRRLGGPASERDEAGVDYIRRQMIPPAQRLANWRTAMVVGMLRNSLYIIRQGDDWYPTYTQSGAAFQINFQLPAANQSQLNMLAGGNILDVSWNNPGANIPAHLLAINAAFEQLAGSNLSRVYLNSVTWGHVIVNDYVAAGHGIANPPFRRFTRVMGERPNGGQVVEHVGELLSVPGVEFIIMDEGLEIGAPGSEVFTKHFPDGTAVFMPEPTNDTFEMLLGSEPVAEYDNAPWQVKMGASSWGKTSHNPTGYEIFTLDNCLPVPYVPKSYAYATVVF